MELDLSQPGIDAADLQANPEETADTSHLDLSQPGIPASQFQSDESKYGGLGEQAKTAIEQGLSGITRGASKNWETSLGITTPEAITGRQAANPNIAETAATLGNTAMRLATGYEGDLDTLTDTQKTALEQAASGATLGLSKIAETKLLGISPEDIAKREAEHPITATVSNLAGGLVALGPLGEATAGLGTAARLGLGAGVGAGIGGVSGLTDQLAQDNPELNVSKLVTNAGIGAALGFGGEALMPSLAKGFNKLSEILYNPSNEIVSSDSLIDKIRNGYRISNTSPAETRADFVKDLGELYKNTDEASDVMYKDAGQSQLAKDLVNIAPNEAKEKALTSINKAKEILNPIDTEASSSDLTRQNALEQDKALNKAYGTEDRISDMFQPTIEDPAEAELPESFRTKYAIINDPKQTLDQTDAYTKLLDNRAQAMWGDNIPKEYTDYRAKITPDTPQWSQANSEGSFIDGKVPLNANLIQMLTGPEATEALNKPINIVRNSALSNVNKKVIDTQLKDLNQVLEKAQTPLDVHNALTGFATDFDKSIKFDKLPTASQQLEQKTLKQVRESIRGDLKDPGQWGEAGNTYKELSDKYANYIEQRKQFRKDFMTKRVNSEGKTSAIIDPSKVKTFLDNPQNPLQKQKLDSLNNYQNSASRMATFSAKRNIPITKELSAVIKRNWDNMSLNQMQSAALGKLKHADQEGHLGMDDLAALEIMGDAIPTAAKGAYFAAKKYLTKDSGYKLGSQVGSLMQRASSASKILGEVSDKIGTGVNNIFKASIPTINK